MWRRDEGANDAYDAALCRIYLTVMRAAREANDPQALGLALRTARPKHSSTFAAQSTSALFE